MKNTTNFVGIFKVPGKRKIEKQEFKHEFSLKQWFADLLKTEPKGECYVRKVKLPKRIKNGT